ncbi:DUF397 domain-containing protein [Lipingzhangella sp. LS1_29]|uniref:DUF397 domain-containing protein n=1 Tax=Lipingzhangella rawalii TaxID=2055835 RepID=A0ABU2H3E2_9ACTN|nr:DUF397 domain-containing protein [Lipingzhangella rawalii]MDS1269370.1 DUF397 domain-containing protein [Lipingzhangella rawalii]
MNTGHTVSEPGSRTWAARRSSVRSAGLLYVGQRWLKSSYSEAASGCLQVRHCQRGWFSLRDSTTPHGVSIWLGSTAWVEFVVAVRRGEFG